MDFKNPLYLLSLTLAYFNIQNTLSNINSDFRKFFYIGNGVPYIIHLALSDVVSNSQWYAHKLLITLARTELYVWSSQYV